MRSLRGHDDSERIVESLFLGVQVGDFLRFRGPGKRSRQVERTARAQKWLTEHSLLAWVVGRNASKGLAIPSGALATEREQFVEGHAADASRAYWLERVSRLGK